MDTATVEKETRSTIFYIQSKIVAVRNQIDFYYRQKDMPISQRFGAKHISGYYLSDTEIVGSIASLKMELRILLIARNSVEYVSPSLLGDIIDETV